MFDQHVKDYEDYLSNLDWEAACEQQKQAEGRWLDNGCRWPNDYDY